jgi:gluconokinase
MGVAGSGKTAVGAQLARALGWPFRDADAFHSARNIARMTAGTPLYDRDRAPWLAAIRLSIEGCLERDEPSVVTCSALKRSYRHQIVVDRDRVKLVYLRGGFGLILERLRKRKGHFMKAAMLRSQFRILEPPYQALAVEIALPVDQIVARIRREFSL